MDIPRTDDNIMTQQLVLCDLYTPRNSHSIISRLPNELLAPIFIHCARDYHYESARIPSLYAPDWVNVSHVCSRWRNVALHCLTLWSYIFTMLQRWTEILLARSKQAPLKIRI